MPTGLTYKIAEGSAVTLSDIVNEMIRGFVFDFRDRDTLTPLAKVIADADLDVAEAEDQVQKAFSAILEHESKGDAEILAERAAAWEAQSREYAKYNENAATVAARYDAAIAKLEAWAPPPEMLGLREGFLKHLRETRESEVYTWVVSIDRTEPAHSIRETERQYLQDYHRRSLEKLARVRKSRIETVAFYTALHAELARLKEQG